MTRNPQFTPPIRKLLVIFDYFIHESSGDYFSNQSYTGITFKEIPKYKLDGSINFLRDQVDSDLALVSWHLEVAQYPLILCKLCIS